MRGLPLAWLLGAALPAAAFEVDAFKTGMTREQVKEALKSYAFDTVRDFSETTLIAYDQAEKGTRRQLVFDFCNGRLVGLQQEVAASNRNLSIVIANYNRRFGQPLRVDASNNVTNQGERSEIRLHWRRGTDVVGVTYVVVEPVEQLMLRYDSPNNCWQVPR